MDKYFQNLTDIVNLGLLKGVDPKTGTLETAIHYAMSVQGKRLRPLLFLTFINAFHEDIEDYIDIACAIEYIHTYSLIHDDLPCMDNDDLRRGIPTLHKKFNEAIALLTGDTLLTIAFEKISYANLKPSVAIAIIRNLSTSIGIRGMAGGQIMDLQFSGDKHQIYQIHHLKTANLIKGTLLSASEIVGLEESEKKTLSQAAIDIGIAFQLADDVLDIEGDEEVVGKKLNKDKLNQSPNSVLFFGMNHVKKEIDRLYQQSLQSMNTLNIKFRPFFGLLEKMVFRSK